jgi:putative ABC transport system permease protein
LNLLKLAAAYLRAQGLGTGLNIVLMALGVAAITVVLLFTSQVEDRFLLRDAEGIDLVVGAKGSPLQLVLSAVYHLDVPTGNIPLAEAERIQANAMIAKAIPLALGDTYRGYRIVGTNAEYLAHYGAHPAEGRLWDAPLEAVLGQEVAAATGLKVGSRFTGSHGLAAGGEAHDEHEYDVVGLLPRTGTVLDRLVLTSIESVWEVHDHEVAPVPVAAALVKSGEAGAAKRADDDEVDDDDREGSDEEESFAPREITALLLQYSTPLAAAMLPRQISAVPSLMAASPAFESARLMRLVGVGTEALKAFAVIMMAAAGLSIFVALYNALRQRRYDLAIMRTLGASRGKVTGVVLMEGLLLGAAGAVAGILLGHLMTAALGVWLRNAQQMDVTGGTFISAELWLIGLAVGVGVLAALVPAISAYRTDVAQTLSRG